MDKARSFIKQFESMFNDYEWKLNNWGKAVFRGLKLKYEEISELDKAILMEKMATEAKLEVETNTVSEYLYKFVKKRPVLHLKSSMSKVVLPRLIRFYF